MKKLFVLMAILALALAACGDKDTSDDGNGNGTTLTINNESSVEIFNVKWHGTEFSDDIYGRPVIGPGGTSTKSVSPGSGYIAFADSMSPFDAITFQTQEAVVVEQNKKVVFTLTNNTIIKDSFGNTGTIGGGY